MKAYDDVFLRTWMSGLRPGDKVAVYLCNSPDFPLVEEVRTLLPNHAKGYLVETSSSKCFNLLGEQTIQEFVQAYVRPCTVEVEQQAKDKLAEYDDRVLIAERIAKAMKVGAKGLPEEHDDLLIQILSTAAAGVALELVRERTTRS